MSFDDNVIDPAFCQMFAWCAARGIRVSCPWAKVALVSSECTTQRERDPHVYIHLVSLERSTGLCKCSLEVVSCVAQVKRAASHVINATWPLESHEKVSFLRAPSYFRELRRLDS